MPFNTSNAAELGRKGSQGKRQVDAKLKRKQYVIRMTDDEIDEIELGAEQHGSKRAEFILAAVRSFKEKKISNSIDKTKK